MRAKVFGAVSLGAGLIAILIAGGAGVGHI